MHLQLFSMSIVTLTSQTYALQNYQALQNYNYHPLNSTLDPITTQIIKTQDSALEVVKLIENGTASRFLENQNKTMRSYTWIGKLMDKLFGWGEYHPDFEVEARYFISQTAKRNVLEWDCLNNVHTMIRGFINSSLEVQKFLNNSCNRLDIIQYYTELFQLRTPQTDAMCRVNTCVRNRLIACYPDCWPCQNATDEEKNTFLNETTTLKLWPSKIDGGMTWASYISGKNENNDDWVEINAWLNDQINIFFNSTVTACEEAELKRGRSNYGYFALLIVPLAVGGIVFGVHKAKQNARQRILSEIMPLS